MSAPSRPLERILAALERAGSRGRGSSWMCPAHDDRRASLSVREGDDGRVLLRCHAGCDLEDILRALGVEERDLFPDGDRRRDEPVATYDYVDEAGGLLFQVLRFPGKRFLQRRPDGRGGWVWNLDGTRRVLYRLPAVLEAGRAGGEVWIAEGEKDVHALEELGLIATTNPGGAGKWRPEYAETLRGARVRVVADRDEPGRRHAREVAASLRRAGVEVVAVVEPPEGSKDVSDLLSRGGKLEDLVPLEAGTAAGAVGLGALLGHVEAFVRRFVVFTSDHQAVAVTLWVVHVYAIDAAPCAAYLRITSATEEAGKTTLLEVLELLLGERCLNAVSATPAFIFRTREKVGPVALLLDEIDQTLRDRKDDGARDLLALVNAGYRRSAKVGRTVGQGHEPKAFPAFGPCAIAGLGTLHPTTESRCIPIVLERKPRGTGEWFLRHLVEDEAASIRAALEAWATEETVLGLREARPDLPSELRSRHAEVWWPLLAIADAAGGEWPDRARRAAVALHAGREGPETMSTGVLLLAHVRQAFEDAGADRLPTAELLARLVENEEGPWGRWWGAEVSREGAPRAAAADLARHLRAFRTPEGEPIRPRVIRLPDGSTPRGYRLEDFAGAFARYLPGGDATPATDATPLASNVASVASVAGGSGTEGDEAGRAVQPTPGCVRCQRYGPDHGGTAESPCIAAWEHATDGVLWLRRHAPAWGGKD